MDGDSPNILVNRGQLALCKLYVWLRVVVE
jgi:hypothetical protein